MLKHSLKKPGQQTAACLSAQAYPLQGVLAILCPQGYFETSPCVGTLSSCYACRHHQVNLDKKFLFFFTSSCSPASPKQLVCFILRASLIEWQNVLPFLHWLPGNSESNLSL